MVQEGYMSIKAKLTLFWFVTAVVSFAATTTCQPTTFDQYLNGTICQTGDRIFSNFQFSSTSPSLQPSQLHIQPLSNGGFFFPLPLSITSAPDGSAMTLGFVLGYEVMAVNNEQFNSFQVDFNAGGFHNGFAALTTDYCLGHSVVGCPAGQGGALPLQIGSIPPGTFNQTVNFPTGAQDLFLRFTATLNSGVQGSASFVQFENSLPVGPVGGIGGNGGVPEPGTFLSSGFALLLLGRFVRRRS